jgi:hypothetical protein
MSFTDKLILWLHIAFAIFTIGPLALAISSTPRYIRRRDLAILRYLTRITMIFTATSLLVLVFGIVLGQEDHDFARPWLTVAMTLFVVALVLLMLIIRDQLRAVRALTPGAAPAAGHVMEKSAVPAAAGAAAEPDPAAGTGEQAGGEADGGGSDVAAAGTVPETTGPETTAAATAEPDPASIAEHVASVEHGRIAAMGGVVNLIWLVILVLMVWRP